MGGPQPPRRSREAHEIRYALTVDDDSGRLLATIYRLMDVEATPVVIRFENLEAGPFEVVVRDIASNSVFFRAFRDDPSPLTVTLPPGTYTVTGNFFPAVAETVLTVGREETKCSLANPARGAFGPRAGAPGRQVSRIRLARTRAHPGSDGRRGVRRSAH